MGSVVNKAREVGGLGKELEKERCSVSVEYRIEVIYIF